MVGRLRSICLLMGAPDLFFLLATLLSFANDLQKLTIEPFDFQLENDPATYIRGLWGLYIQEDILYIIPKNDPYVLQIDPKTKAMKRIGGKGLGPGELGHSFPWGLSLGESSMWVLDTYRARASFYKDGVFHTSFKVKNYQISGSTDPKYAFAHNGLFVVIPAFPASKALANVYDYSGELVQKLGHILPLDEEMLKYNPAVNDTIWRFHKGNWYCLFVYRPIIQIYDALFELKKEIQIVGPEVDLFEERFHQMEVDPLIKAPAPHFTDFQVTSSNLLVMCMGVLYQMDHQGKVLSRTGFYGNRDIEAAVGYKPRVHFGHAVVNSRGRVYLGAQGEFYFDHDLWFVDAPHLKAD